MFFHNFHVTPPDCSAFHTVALVVGSISPGESWVRREPLFPDCPNPNPLLAHLAPSLVTMSTLDSATTLCHQLAKLAEGSGAGTDYNVSSALCALGYIPLGVVFALRWQLNPTPVKCTCNANGYTYILHGFLIKMRNIWGCVL